MRGARVIVVALLLGLGLTGAYFGVRGQGPRLPWPPAPVTPPANFEESEAPPELPKKTKPTPKPIPPPDLVPASTVVRTRFEQTTGPDLPPPAPIQVEVVPPPLPSTAAPEPKKPAQAKPKSIPSKKTTPTVGPNDLVVLPSGPVPLPPVVQPNSVPTIPEPRPKPAPRSQAVTPPLPETRVNSSVENTDPPKLKAFQLVNPIRRPGTSYPTPPLDSPPPLDSSLVQALPVAQARPVSPNPTYDGNATPQVTVDKRGPAAARAGETMTFYILVRNVGSSTAAQVRVEDDIPAGMRMVGADPRPAVRNDRAIWIIPELPPGADKQLKIELQAPQGGDLVSATSVFVGTSATLRTHISQDASARRESRPVAETLSLIVKAPANVAVGSPVVFEVVVTNHGKDELTKVVLHGILPAGLTHPFGREIEADVSNLPPGTTKLFKMPVTAAQVGRQTANVKITTKSGVEASGTAAVEVLPRGTPRIRSASSLGLGSKQ